MMTMELNKASTLVIVEIQKFPEDYYLLATITSSILLSISLYKTYVYGYEYIKKFNHVGEMAVLMAVVIQLFPRAMIGVIPRYLYSYFETDFRLAAITYYPSVLCLQIALTYFDTRELFFTTRWLMIASVINMIASYLNIAEAMTGYLNLNDGETVKSLGILSILLNIIFTVTILRPTCRWLQQIYSNYPSISSKYSNHSIVYITTISVAFSLNLLSCLIMRLLLIAEVVMHGEEGFNAVIGCYYRVIQLILMINHTVIGIMAVLRSAS